MVKQGEISLQPNFAREAKLFRSLRDDQIEVVTARVFLRSMYLLASELDSLSEEKILSALKLALFVCSAGGSSAFKSEASWGFNSDAEEITFYGSTRAIEFRIAHSSWTQIYEFSWEQNPDQGDSSGHVFFDLNDTTFIKKNEVDAGNLLTDLEFLTGNRNSGDLFKLPIWSNMPEHIDQDISKLINTFESDPQKWAFWQQWFQGYLSGTPIEWALENQVCQIRDLIWDQGAEAVAREIEQIRKRMAVERAVDELRQNLGVRSLGRFGIGGNQPPGLSSDLQFQNSVTLIWDTVEDLSEELEKAQPDFVRLEAILKSLQTAFATMVKWTGRKADLAIDATIKWSIPLVGGAYIAQNPEKIQILIRAMQEWLPLLR